VQVAIESLTTVAAVTNSPKRQTVLPRNAEKPLPEIETTVPPVARPTFGNIEVGTGEMVYSNTVDDCEKSAPPLLLSLTGTLPAALIATLVTEITFVPRRMTFSVELFMKNPVAIWTSIAEVPFT
jgi:hypothetical protein